MHKTTPPVTGYWIAVLAAALFATPTLADKHGKGHGENHGQRERHQSEKHDEQRPFDQPREPRYAREPYFSDQHRQIVREFYVEEYRDGHCPPGLAKKRNGCQPPGQAKRWTIGRPLPRDVVYYELPATVLGRIGAPPPGYRFVRVASDILMIAVGSGLVLDAIADLNGMP